MKFKLKNFLKLELGLELPLLDLICMLLEDLMMTPL